jgi:CPA2 family monovalent cation:H+ antiporter-2
VCLLTLVLLTPFLWALAIKTPSEVYRKMIDARQYRRTFYLVRFIRLALVAFFVGFLLHRFFNIYVGIVFTALVLMLLVIFSKKIQSFYNRLERRFMINLNERETETSRLNRTELAPWDAHMASLTVPQLAPCVGKTLLELRWRETIGINVVMIKRGDRHLPIPGKEEMIFPGDELLVLGTDLQIQKLRVLIKPEDVADLNADTDVELYNYSLTGENTVVGKTIRESGLREKAGALMVGIERNGERILNPESELVLQAGDILFIVANRRKLRSFLSHY